MTRREKGGKRMHCFMMAFKLWMASVQLCGLVENIEWRTWCVLCGLPEIGQAESKQGYPCNGC